MTSTVPDEHAVVNLVRPNLGHGARDLYDWLKAAGRMGGKRRVELTPPVSRYEQVASRLRERIFSGEFPPGATLPSGPGLGKTLGVSQPVVQRGFEVLAREGLVRMEPGRGTVVLARHRFRAAITVKLPLDEKIRAKALTSIRRPLAKAAGGQPAVAEAEAQRGSSGLMLTMTVESADLAGAATVALGVAREAAGTMPVTAITAAED